MSNATIVRDASTGKFILRGPYGFRKEFLSDDLTKGPEQREYSDQQILTQPAAKATANISYTNNPANDDTVVVNGTTFTFKTTLTGGVPTEVLIGAEKHATWLNFTNAVNTVKPSNIGCEHDPVQTWSVTLFAPVVGTGGNSLTITGSVTNATLPAGGLFTGGRAADYGVLTYTFYRKVTLAEINAGEVTLLPAIGAKVDPGFAYRIISVDIMVDGTAAGATSIDITHTPNGFPESTWVWTIAGGELTATNVPEPTVTSARMRIGYNGYPVTIKKVGSNLSGVSNVEVLITYTIENGWIT